MVIDAKEKTKTDRMEKQANEALTVQNTHSGKPFHAGFLKERKITPILTRLRVALPDQTCVVNNINKVAYL